MFGGSTQFEDVGDTWTFSYRSDTPDEICNDQIDNDGDRQVDALDPDCT